MALSENIKKLREEKKFTQQQLADRLYVSRQTVCRWENGSRCPDLITAKQLATELNVSLDELISDEDVKDYQKNYGIWKSEKVRSRKKLQELQKKTLSFIEIIGALFLTAYNIFSCSDASKSTGMVYDSLSLCCVRSCCAESCDFPETEKDRRPLRIVIPETDDIIH